MFCKPVGVLVPRCGHSDKQAVSILRQVVKGLVCFDDMTLDELRGLIAFLRGRMPDRDERTGDGSRESLNNVWWERSRRRTGDGSGESRGREDPPTVIVVEERELRRFAKLEKPLLRAAVKLAFKKDPHEMQLLVIRRLVFGCDGTILIAKTGFGKSLTFQAFTILTGCWTIILVIRRPIKKGMSTSYLMCVAVFCPPRCGVAVSAAC